MADYWDDDLQPAAAAPAAQAPTDYWASEGLVPDAAATAAASPAAQPAASNAAQPPGTISGGGADLLANILTGAVKGEAAIPALPDTIVRGSGMAANWLSNKLNGTKTPYAPDAMTKWADAALPTQEGMEKLLFSAPGMIAPYQPKTDAGAFVQGAGATLPIALATGGLGAAVPYGIEGGSANVAAKEFPNSPIAPLLAAIAAKGSVVGLSKGYGAAKMLANPTAEASANVSQDLANAAGVTPGDLANKIDATAPANPDVELTTGAQTGDPGVMNLQYQRSKELQPELQAKQGFNNVAFNKTLDDVIANAAPAPGSEIPGTASNADVQIATNKLGDGLAPADAGEAIRNSLSDNYQQATAARQALFQPYDDMVKNSTRTIDLTPVLNDLRDDIYQSTGARADALQAAMKQFTPPPALQSSLQPIPTQSTLIDTAGNPLDLMTEKNPGLTNINHAQQVLENLGDVANGYTAGSKQQAAVLGVRNALKAHLADNAPEVLARNNAYAQLSKPVDIYENPKAATGVVAKALATDRYGKYDIQQNSELPDKFLTGAAVPEKLNAFVQAHGGDQTALKPLEQHIVGQIKGSAINSDGTLNTAALDKIQGRYASALGHFPDLTQKIGNLRAAQAAKENAQALENNAAGVSQDKLKLLDTLKNGYRTLQVDPQGRPVIGDSFIHFVRNNDAKIRATLGDIHADQVKTVADYLEKQLQPVYARAKGTSGTGQQNAIASDGGHNVVKALFRENAGALGGTVLGWMSGLPGLARVGQAAGSTAGLVSGALKAHQQAVYEQIMNRALVDPDFAKDLLTKYNGKSPTAAQKQTMLGVTAKLAALPAIGETTANGVKNAPH